MLFVVTLCCCTDGRWSGPRPINQCVCMLCFLMRTGYMFGNTAMLWLSSDWGLISDQFSSKRTSTYMPSRLLSLSCLLSPLFNTYLSCHCFPVISRENEMKPHFSQGFLNSYAFTPPCCVAACSVSFLMSMITPARLSLIQTLYLSTFLLLSIGPHCHQHHGLPKALLLFLFPPFDSYCLSPLLILSLFLISLPLFPTSSENPFNLAVT